MKWTLVAIVLITFTNCKTIPNGIGVGFYNVENLFDTKDDPQINDADYLPNSHLKWDETKYNKKLENLAFVISQMVDDELPQFLGLCEIENKQVVQDLIAQPKMKTGNYGIVHFDSDDERGIDVAFLYNKSIFTVKKATAYEVKLPDGDRTRDILFVKGKLGNGETLYFFVNHWPSRGEGVAISEPKRIIAAQTLKKLKDEILTDDPKAKIIVMGDFNDEPANKSIKDYLGAKGNSKELDGLELYNPMADLQDKDLGSYRFRDFWDMLDQIMVSQALLSVEKEKVYYLENSASIKDEYWMRQHGSKYEGFPLRTYGGQNYLGGYSDHFPVYIKLIIEPTK